MLTANEFEMAYDQSYVEGKPLEMPAANVAQFLTSLLEVDRDEYGKKILSIALK